MNRFIRFIIFKFKLIFYWHRRCREKLSIDWSSVGYNRIAIVNAAISSRGGRHCRYLEIGCDRNQVFFSVPCDTKVGVDPQRGGSIRKTSDEFFATNTDQFDCIFVDGLHEYGQLYRDLKNALNSLGEGGVVLIHDMIPRDWSEEHVPQLAGVWTGDVWRICLDLMKSSGLSFVIIECDHGIGVVKKTGEFKLCEPQEDRLNRSFDQFLQIRKTLPIVDVRGGIGFILTR